MNYQSVDSTPLPNESVVETRSPEEQRRILNRFLADCSDLRKLETKLGRFSLFRVLRFEEGEIRHSNVLAWLLTPTESHGLDDGFLKRLLIRLKAEHPDEVTLPDVIEVEAATFDEVDIKREWADRKTRDRLDLLAIINLRGGERWAFAIEVKVGATQGKGQLLKYRTRVEHEYTSAARRIYAFLTRDNEAPEEGSDFISMDFVLLHKVLIECVEERGDMIAAGPRNLLDEYIRLLETRFMPENEIQTLARQIYREHREALDLILSYRMDFIQAVSDRIEADLPEHLENLGSYELIKSIKGYVHILPEEWKLDSNKGVRDFPCLYCLVEFYNGNALFRVVLDGGHEGLRSKVIAAATPPDFKRQNKRTPGKSWTAVHSEKLNLSITEDGFGSDEDASNQLIEKVTAILQSQPMKRRIQVLQPILATHDSDIEPATNEPSEPRVEG